MDLGLFSKKMANCCVKIKSFPIFNWLIEFLKFTRDFCRFESLSLAWNEYIYTHRASTPFEGPLDGIKVQLISQRTNINSTRNRKTKAKCIYTWNESIARIRVFIARLCKCDFNGNQIEQFYSSLNLLTDTYTYGLDTSCRHFYISTLFVQRLNICRNQINWQTKKSENCIWWVARLRTEEALIACVFKSGC